MKSRKINKTKNVTAIIPAAGFGLRMQSGQSKYFIEVAGKPVIAHTLEVFEQADEIKDIILVTQADDMLKMMDIVKAFSLSKVKKIIPGGKSRTESVYRGLLELDCETEIVAVHDGVRPFLNETHLVECINVAEMFGAATLAVKCKDTLKIVDGDGSLSNDVDRESTYQIQTPQCFKKEVILKAYKNAMQNNINATDDNTLVQLIGINPKVVQGDYNNIKITTPEDLLLAEYMLGQLL